MHPTFLHINNQFLCQYTTFAVGGQANIVIASQLNEVKTAVAFAKKQQLPIYILGGGSNLLCSDQGVNGLVITLSSPSGTNTGITVISDNDQSQILEIWAGTPWESVVDYAINHQLRGIECLAGIPGKIGAAPVQNIGAYGQSFDEVAVSVQAIDLHQNQSVILNREACRWSYRHSLFKDQPHYLITSVTIQLKKQREEQVPLQSIAYQQLAQRLINQYQSQSFELKQISEMVKTIRAEKSMLYQPSDPNHRSAGSFFTNPIVSIELAQKIEKQAKEEGKKLVQWPDAMGIKLSAGWLIENAGCPPAYQHPQYAETALSSKHSLCIINQGNAKAIDIKGFAEHIQGIVFDKYSVLLKPEVVYWGFN